MFKGEITLAEQHGFDRAVLEFGNASDQTDDFVVTFDDVKYGFFKSTYDKIADRLTGNEPEPEYKPVLSGASGHIRCGQLTAIMGPSGSGKSILLECILGQRTLGFSGQVTYTKNMKNSRTAYVPQNDRMFDSLTAREAVTFSSQLQNIGEHIIMESKTGYHGAGCQDNDEAESAYIEGASDCDTINDNVHSVLASELLDKLGLSVCADTRISMCSGGEQKRIAIAVELVSRPSILVLDEPTSGLDSAACKKVVQLLRNIALGADGSQKVAVIVTIHQPPWVVFDMFHSVLMMNQTGGIIFGGAPDTVVSILALFGLECPKYYNPADYLMEVMRDSDSKVLKSMAQYQINNYKKMVKLEPDSIPRKLCELQSKQSNFPFFVHLYILLSRSLLMSSRGTVLLKLRVLLHVLYPFVITAVVGVNGHASDCPPINSNDTFDSIKYADIMLNISDEKNEISSNVVMLFFLLIFSSFSSLTATVMSLPDELITVSKEINNMWYSGTTYYIATCLSQLPLVVSLTSITTLTFYYLNDMPTDHVWRPFTLVAIQIAVALVNEAQGSLIAAALFNNRDALKSVLPLLIVPPVLMTGYFLSLRNMSDGFVITSFLFPIRFLFELSLMTIYGYGRCGNDMDQTFNDVQRTVKSWVMSTLSWNSGPDLVELYANSSYSKRVRIDQAGKFSNEVTRRLLDDFIGDDGRVRSSVLNVYSLDDDDFWPNVLAVIVLLIAYRILTFILIYRRFNVKR